VNKDHTFVADFCWSDLSVPGRDIKVFFVALLSFSLVLFPVVMVSELGFFWHCHCF